MKVKQLDTNYSITDDFENIVLNYNMETGYYEFLINRKMPLKNTLQELIKLSQYVIDNPPILKEEKKELSLEETIKGMSKEELQSLLLSKIAPKKDIEEIVELDLQEEFNNDDVVVEVKENKFLDKIIEEFDEKFIPTLLPEPLFEVIDELKQYVNGASLESLNTLLEEVNNSKHTNFLLINNLKDIVTKYIGYINAVKALNPNLNVDVYGRSILSTNFVDKGNSGNIFQVPAELTGATTVKVEPEKRGKSPFDSLVQKWRD